LCCPLVNLILLTWTWTSINKHIYIVISFRIPNHCVIVTFWLWPLNLVELKSTKFSMMGTDAKYNTSRILRRGDIWVTSELNSDQEVSREEKQWRRWVPRWAWVKMCVTRYPLLSWRVNLHSDWQLRAESWCILYLMKLREESPDMQSWHEPVRERPRGHTNPLNSSLAVRTMGVLKWIKSTDISVWPFEEVFSRTEDPYVH